MKEILQTALNIFLAFLPFLIGAFFAGRYNAIMDYIKEYQLDKDTWDDKWKWFRVHPENVHPKTRDPYKKKKWYYFGLHTPKYVEAFPFSSTILVFITDRWHEYKFKMFICYELAIMVTIVYYEHLPWWWVPIGIVILKAVRGLGFTLKYDKK